jgi:hypothetical protein
MEYLAIKTAQGMMFCQSRQEREVGITYCLNRGLKIEGIVEKKFDNRTDATIYCDKINSINDLIKTI